MRVKFNLMLENYIPGLYLVVIKDESNIIGSSKLVISR
jgi:hypothetical protein